MNVDYQSFPSSVTPRRGRSSLWAQPILHDEQREFFIPLARAVFITSETSSSHHRSHRFSFRAFALHPLGCALCHPALRAPLTRLPSSPRLRRDKSGFVCVMCYISRGQAPCLPYFTPCGVLTFAALYARNSYIHGGLFTPRAQEPRQGRHIIGRGASPCMREQNEPEPRQPR